MRKSRKWKGKNREAVQVSEAVENPTELPQTFNDEGAPLVVHLTEGEREELLHAVDTLRLDRPFDAESGVIEADLDSAYDKLVGAGG